MQRGKLKWHSLTSDKVASSTQRGRRQQQISYRGASPSTVPKKSLKPQLSPGFQRLEGEAIRTNSEVQIFGHLSANHRHLQPGKQRFRLGEGKPDVVRRGRQHRTGDAYQLLRLHLTLARPCLQPHRPFHERLLGSRPMRVTPPNSLPASQGCPRFLPLYTSTMVHGNVGRNIS